MSPFDPPPGVPDTDPPPGPAGDPEPFEDALGISRDHLRGLLEALVFASEKPMSSGELAKAAGAPPREVKNLMGELKEHYARRGVVLEEVAGGWLFRTHVKYAPFVREQATGRPAKLSRAQIETLAITAYRQPITRPEIDEIRGVDSGATLKVLLDRELLRILGKKDEPGRPLLYGTTSQFLELFGLKSLRDLPTLREFTELSDDSRRLAEAEGVGSFDPEGRRTEAPGALVPEAPDGPEDGFAATEPPTAPGDGPRDTVIPSAPPTGDADDPPGSIPPALQDGI